MGFNPSSQAGKNIRGIETPAQKPLSTIYEDSALDIQGIINAPKGSGRNDEILRSIMEGQNNVLAAQTQSIDDGLKFIADASKLKNPYFAVDPLPVYQELGQPPVLDDPSLFAFGGGDSVDPNYPKVDDAGKTIVADTKPEIDLGNDFIKNALETLGGIITRQGDSANLVTTGYNATNQKDTTKNDKNKNIKIIGGIGAIGAIAYFMLG